MSIKKHGVVTIILAITFFSFPALALFSGLAGFSEAFQHDYEAAEKMADKTKSATPLLALLPRYTNAVEQAELEVSIGVIFGQRTGIVNPSNAVVHLSKALAYELPERTYIQVLQWRGNSSEQILKREAALMDYLRGLLACSYYDLTGGWPSIQDPKARVMSDSFDPVNAEQLRDDHFYWSHLDYQRFLLMQRYYFIEGVKRVREDKSDGQILELLHMLTPDAAKTGTIVDWLKSENKQPWP